MIILLILFANTGLRLMEEVNEGNLPSIFLIQLLSLKMIQYSTLLIPISLFYGVIVALSRLNVSNEMVIMKTSGYSSRCIAKILSKLILLATFTVMIFTFFITPLTVDYRMKVQHQIIHEQKIYSLKERNFNSSNDKSKIIYIQNKNDSRPANIFIKSEENKSTRIDIASGIEVDKKNKDIVVLKNGASYVFGEDKSFTETKYADQDILLSNKIPKLENNDIESKSIFELFDMQDVSSLSEKLKRVSMIIATMLLGYLSIPISQTKHREDKYKNIFLATIFYFTYIILINIFTKTFVSTNYMLGSFVILHFSYLLITYKYYISSETINS